MEELAEVARMGLSTLHDQFCALTAMSRCNIRNRFDFILRGSGSHQRIGCDGYRSIARLLDFRWLSCSLLRSTYYVLRSIEPFYV
jgi:hypothetical protein